MKTATDSFQCVKPIGGFDKPQWDICPNTAEWQGSSPGLLRYCTEHKNGYSGTRWVPINAHEAVAARAEWDQWVAEYQRQKSAEEAWAADNPDLIELAEQVHAHAKEHYSEGGWDVLVECWSVVDIAKRLAADSTAPSTADAAVDSFRAVVDVWQDRQADAVNSAF